MWGSDQRDGSPWLPDAAGHNVEFSVMKMHSGCVHHHEAEAPVPFAGLSGLNLAWIDIDSGHVQAAAFGDCASRRAHAASHIRIPPRALDADAVQQSLRSTRDLDGMLRATVCMSKPENRPAWCHPTARPVRQPSRCLLTGQEQAIRRTNREYHIELL